MSDIGSYIGLGSSANPVIVTGFRPAFVMIKNTTSGSTSWVMADDRRGYSDLYANDASAEFASGSLYGAHFLSNGFTTNTADVSRNASGQTYIYLAIAEQVYNANAVTANQTNPFNDGSQVAQYEFEDNADDSQPNGYIGKGGTFDGSSSKIDLPNGAGSTGAITVSTWINTNNISTTQGIWSFGSTSGYAVECLIESGYLFFRMLNSSGTAGFGIQTGTGYISNNTWHNIVCIFPNTTASNACKIYIDGVERITGTSTLGSVTRNTSNSGFGGRFYSGSLSLPFTGSIDQVRTYNTALNPNDVWLLYSETSATSSTLDYPASKGAIALYELEEDATSTSSSTYDGAATAVAWVPLYDGTDGGTVTYAAPSVSAPFLKAGVFNGTTSKIVLGTNTFNSLTNFSFSCWVNLNNAPTGYEYLFDGWDYQSASSRGLIVRITPSANIQVYTGLSNSVTNITSSETITHGVWTHIAVSITQTNTTISINGNIESPQSNGGFDFHTGTTYNLGAFIYTSSFYEFFLDGKLDQVRIFNKALDSGEILQLYNEPNN
jgi:hypothetical protein